MDKTEIKSNFQFLDNYIVDSKIHIITKKNCNKKLELNVEVKISEFKKENNQLTAEMRLKNSVKVYDKETNEEIANIEVEMSGIFSGTNLEEKEFMKFMKYSGTPILSQSIRAHIMTLTSISGIDTIRLPLINYVKYFENDDMNENKNSTL